MRMIFKDFYQLSSRMGQILHFSDCFLMIRFTLNIFVKNIKWVVLYTYYTYQQGCSIWDAKFDPLVNVGSAGSLHYKDTFPPL